MLQSERCGAGPRALAKSLVEQFGAYITTESSNNELLAIPLGELKPGMIITQDVLTSDGALLVARGFEITDVFLEHAPTLAPDLLTQPVRVLVRST